MNLKSRTSGLLNSISPGKNYFPAFEAQFFRLACFPQELLDYLEHFFQFTLIFFDWDLLFQGDYTFSFHLGFLFKFILSLLEFASLCLHFCWPSLQKMLDPLRNRPIPS